MRKITLYAISKCPINSSDEDFIKNLCTLVSNKKDISEYLLNKVIIDNWSHYCRWVELHYADREDDFEKRRKYINVVLEGPKAFKDYCIKKQQYTPDRIASIFRIINHCVPVGASYEKDNEVEALNQFFQEIVKNVEKLVDLEKEK